MNATQQLPDHARVVVVGTGFAGVGMGAALLKKGVTDFVLLERASDLGGTWRDNSYPGCACDVPSHLYSFSFAPNPGWTRTFSPQQEIWDYIRSVSDSRGVTPHIRFDADVTDASWDEGARVWRVGTVRGDLTCDVLVSGTGALSDPAYPDLAGLDSFAGTTFHSATWNYDHDLTGRRVAVIGTGASAVQFVPHVQRQAAHLTLFQRTPPWIMPRPDRAVSGLERHVYRRFPAAQKAMRGLIYSARETFVVGFRGGPRLMRLAQRGAEQHLAHQVKDPGLRATLTPDYALGCKRVLLSNDYLPALTRENVDVVSEKIVEVRPEGVVTADGAVHEVDTIIFGTGFRVGELPFADTVRGVGGEVLGRRWARESVQAYRGTTVSGYPNLFFLVGPNTGLGHSSMVYMIESQVAYVVDALRTMQEQALATVEVSADRENRFNDSVQRSMRGTVWTAGGCSSWYLDARGRNSLLWPGFTFSFRRITRKFDRAAYLTTPLPRRSPEPAQVG